MILFPFLSFKHWRALSNCMSSPVGRECRCYRADEKVSGWPPNLLQALNFRGPIRTVHEAAADDPKAHRDVKRKHSQWQPTCSSSNCISCDFDIPSTCQDFSLNFSNFASSSLQILFPSFYLLSETVGYRNCFERRSKRSVALTTHNSADWYDVQEHRQNTSQSSQAQGGHQ